MSLTETAISLALEGHKNKKDKSSLPYILHPLRVMLKMNTEEMIPAVLHDVLEYTKINEGRLLSEDISLSSVNIIKLLTGKNNVNILLISKG